MKRDIKQQKMNPAGHAAHKEYEKNVGADSQRCDAAGTSARGRVDEREYYRALAQQHWDSLGKPIDSLGVLEQHVTKLCMIERTAQPHIDRRALAVLCADHGCVREGVTQTDSSVTRVVAENFAHGLTTTSVLAQQFAVDLFPIDVGMLAATDSGTRTLSSRPMSTSELASSRTSNCESDAGQSSDAEVISSSGCQHEEEKQGCAALRTDLVNDRCLQHGSGDIAIEPAMSEEVGERALALGRRLVRTLKAQGYDILLTGEMGIGNTTPTSALFSAYLGLPVEETVGRGAGLSDEGLERKRDCVRRALRRVGIELDAEREASLGDDRPVDSTQMFMPSGAPDPASKQAWQCGDDAGMAAKTRPCRAKQLLFELGGLEIATMAGMFLGAVEEQIPIVIDGAISTAAALAASRICEEEKAVADVTLASHVSKDGAARKALEALGLRAIIDADMSLGEGSGAVLLIPMLDAALAVYRGMGSFDDIHVEAYHRFK